ncbi:uncharacterized protein LOC130785505 [Actinidia eriantha]|uniref:uncharacterized protein LOC130785505 n=1 Tax=Actinidia eriantha TaxID=165200 RepID=UPI0025857B23|nr:uncharacterized protein LOC130785505 [Actinidia eriantha]
MDKKARKESKISRYFKAPFRVLAKAHDFYINSLIQCAGRAEFGGAMTGPTAQVSSSLPKSFSVNSSKASDDEDLRDLIRAASTRSLSNKVQLELLRRQQFPVAAVEVVPRSQSAGIGRIDEDKPCEFEEGDVKVNTDVYPRSKSYAVSKRTTGL